MVRKVLMTMPDNIFHRSKVIDAEKGLCMILIIAGHSPYIPHMFESFITMFHVPLFFFVSAYLFNYTPDFSTFAKRKINTLLKPLFFVVVITSVLSFVKLIVKGYIYEGFTNLLYSLGGGTAMEWNVI